MICRHRQCQCTSEQIHILWRWSGKQTPRALLSNGGSFAAWSRCIYALVKRLRKSWQWESLCHGFSAGFCASAKSVSRAPRLHMHEHHFDRLSVAYAGDEIVPCYWCCRPCFPESSSFFWLVSCDIQSLNFHLKDPHEPSRCVTKKGQHKSSFNPQEQDVKVPQATNELFWICVTLWLCSIWLRNRLPFWGSHERVCRENPSKPVLPGQARGSTGLVCRCASVWVLDASETDRLVVLRVLKPPAENGTGGEARPGKNV